MGYYSKKFFSIKNDREFRFLFNKGETLVNYAFICYYKPNKRRRNRIGIVTGKKIGNAVKRNRSRRVIKEAFRLFEPELRNLTDTRYDFIFVARGKTASIKSTKILGILNSKLKPLLIPSTENRNTNG